jgi:hypothetical protein
MNKTKVERFLSMRTITIDDAIPLEMRHAFDELAQPYRVSDIEPSWSDILV